MGNWQLEIGKFAMYVFAPVVAFYVYHKVKYDIFSLERLERFPHKKNVNSIDVNSSIHLTNNFLFTFLKVDFFNEDLEQFNRKINTPQMLANEKQMKEDLELLKRLRESSIRKKLENLAKD